MILFTTVIIWLLETAKYWFVMHAFDFNVSFFTLMLMNGIVNLATTIPAAPGYVGTFDLPGIKVLQAYGVPQAVAASYTLVLHAALWFPITLLGAYYYLRQPLRWGGEMQKLRDEDQPVQEEPKNMGAWRYFRSRYGDSMFGRTLSCVSRPASASPATGSASRHKQEQRDVVAGAFAPDDQTRETRRARAARAV